MALHGATPNRKVAEDEEYELRAPHASPSYGEGDGRIIHWRVVCFEALGFDPLEALALAIRRDIDREEVARLIQAGATPIQVLGIMT